MSFEFKIDSEDHKVSIDDASKRFYQIDTNEVPKKLKHMRDSTKYPTTIIKRWGQANV